MSDDREISILREAAARAILGAFHDLRPRIPGLEAGDCHCNLLAEVALTALVEAGCVIRPAIPRPAGETPGQETETPGAQPSIQCGIGSASCWRGTTGRTATSNWGTR